ncbi:threonine dehydrogenase-like Zn-dependent dehydrogenase [Haloactinomyces albus]|uniref:Threonine dehydrogenase-like Zn-dependent dehydrogenase n=1 Tax=Haloactinomyces albus TaxID=1352928 RepID=A0AAE3ZBY6_9ACTN|nr:alcohol dehydrogenase catalytic domain-containing protein [Haloactinomyces albus]MDR7301080.1 threonine dehydrogenase-like Zn-dependent dehydrogenase [Haloactinomyces albus]
MDASLRPSAVCVCGSDLWPYRGVEHVDGPRPMGHEYVGVVEELTGGLGAHGLIGAVGIQEAMMQAIRATRLGGHVGYVGITHDVRLPGEELFFSQVHLHGGHAPVRRFLPQLIELIFNREIDPGKVFDLTLPLEQAAEITEDEWDRLVAVNCAECSSACDTRSR